MTADRSLTPSTLGRLQGRSPKNEQEVRAMAAALHHSGKRVAVIWLDEVRNQERRQAIETELDVQYGKPTKKDITK